MLIASARSVLQFHHVHAVSRTIPGFVIISTVKPTSAHRYRTISLHSAIDRMAVGNQRRTDNLSIICQESALDHAAISARFDQRLPCRPVQALLYDPCALVGRESRREVTSIGV